MAELSPPQQSTLGHIVDLMNANNLSAGDVKKSWTARRKAVKSGGQSRQLTKNELVQRLFIYLGGTLIFAGLGVFISTIWDDIGSLPRVIITFGSGFTAYLCAVVFSFDKRYESAVTPAFIIAFLLQPYGLFVLLKEYFEGGDAALGSMIVFAPLALQQALTFLKLKRPSLLLFALLYFIGFSGSFVEYYDLNRGMSSLVFGLFLLLATIDMQLRSRIKDLTPIFFIISTLLFFAGIYYYVGRTVFDPVALSLILSLLGFAVTKESKTLYVLCLIYMSAYFAGGPGGGWWNGNMDWTTYNEITAIVTGTSLVLTGHWLRDTNYISLHPLWMFVGTGFALAGTYAIFPDYLEPVSIIFSVAAIYAALQLHSRAMLASAILSLIGFIIDFSAKYFADTIGWPILLMILGFIVLGCGFMFARLSGRIKQAAA